VYWTGAFVSFTGNWIQTVAQGWLVYHLTRDPATLALVSFAGQAPVFFMGPFTGAVADSFDKRRVVIVTQTSLALTALTLAAVTLFGYVEVWHILLLGLLNGIIWSFDVPARQSLISELVDTEDIANAIPLTGATFNVARLVGPSIGGILLASVGPGVCFLVNGLSYAAMLSGLLAVRPRSEARVEDTQPAFQRMTEGIRTVARTPAFRTLILLEIVISVFGLFYIVQLPAYAADVLGTGKQGLGYLYSAIGVGAVSGLGTLAMLSRYRGRGRVPALAMTGFSLGLLALGLVGIAIADGSSLHASLVAGLCLVVTGYCGTTMLNGTNTLLQANAAEHLRGRVVGVHFWALSGLGPIGTLLFGEIAARIGVSESFLVGAIICLVVALPSVFFARSVRHLR
jgi:MFS family permease